MLQLNILFQTEKAFQKQPNIFVNKKSSLLSGKGKKNLRFVRGVGLGFKTPREVISCRTENANRKTCAVDTSGLD